MKIPKRAQVDRAMRMAFRQVEGALSAVNKEGAKFLRRGRYAEAEGLVALGKEIQRFVAKVDELRQEWRAVTGQSVAPREERGEATPLWQYYQPTLKALVAIGGEARRNELEAELPKHLDGRLKPDDLAAEAGGEPRWKRMVQKARRPMIKEGFLEPVSGKKWKVTAEGRRAAQAESPGPKPRGQG